MSDVSRREFIQRAAVAGAAIQFAGSLSFGQPDAKVVAVELHWLDGKAPAVFAGTTWGVPWPRGSLKRDEALQLSGELPMQTWPIAFWPDGSVKWTAHALGAGAVASDKLILSRGAAAATTQKLIVRETDDAIEIDTGVIHCKVGRRGAAFIQSIERDGQQIARDAKLIARCQDQPEAPSDGAIKHESFTSQIEKATVEQTGPVRAVIRIDGKHYADKGAMAWLPFTLRLYFYAGGESVRIMHTFIFDGDENKDFLRGMGVRFDVPMRDAPHDRHIRFAGEEGGLWAEGVRNLTGLRRDPGRKIIEAQLAGKACPPIEEFPENVRRRLDLIPAWNDYTLFQSSSDAFTIRKRTKEGFAWVTAAHGGRSPGVGYIGGASGGGVVFGLRDFWQRHPTQLDVRNAATDEAGVTLWLWSPDTPAMDLRFYHDGMGMDTYPKQLEGLEITYEDYEPGFGTAHGIARTSEIMLWAVAATPPRDEIVKLAHAVANPPMLVASPQHIHSAGVFGTWGLPDRSTPAKKRIEDQLDWFFDYYSNQREQRRWYGFWDYGDVMHSYDRDRHVWRYDVGGYAWDNSELSPDLWLWYAFLRTGRADIFRFAEAMTRHTGEVDVYHLGKFAKLGTRHNVLHWGCSAKQLRISTAVYRRIYYFLTADERVGDLMRELVDADKTFMTLDPIRKIRREKFAPQPNALGVGFGTDWGSLAAAWLAEWERTGDERIRAKLIAGMRSIGSMPKGFFTDGATYDPDTGAFTAHGDSMGVSHLSAVFGLPEICAELLQNFDVPEFEKAWLQYCQLYSAPREEQEKALGVALRGNSLTNAHSRLTAYAAWKKNDKELAARAWKEFGAVDAHLAASPTPQRYSGKTTRITGPAVLTAVDEAPWVSTNDASQWSLAAIQNLALIGDVDAMNMGVADWLVVCVPVLLVALIAWRTRRYTRSVADFMAANRCAGRYLVATAQGEASYGAANVIAQFELFFLAGFTYAWWLTFNNIVWLFILLSGFIIYRYRESRVLTLAQFFEVRYSKAFRVFAGCLAFLSGLLAYGIYPAVGSRFFVYFCGFPQTFELMGATIATFIPVMVVLLLPGVLLTTMGGQLTLMVVDCLEGIISLIFYLCIAAALMVMFAWSDIAAAMQRPPQNSLFNPFDASQNSAFGFWYVMIAIFINAYGWQSSQVGHGFRSAAINAHEQKMGAILGPWRNEVRTLMLTVLCICAIAFLKSPAGGAAVAHALDTVKGTALENQLRTPAALGLMLPPVIRGMFAAIMLFALISTDCTMMHSWGTIFVQDIVVPLRKRPMQTRQHVNLLRIAVVCVALFAFLFSALVPQTTYINMFLAITGAVFAGAGACIIGGFYWKRGTTAAAWAAMTSAALLAVLGETITQTWKPWLYPWLAANAPGLLEGTNRVIRAISATIPNLNWHISPNEFFLNRMWITCFATLMAIVSYFAVTFLTYRQDFNLDRMLHRGPYAVEGEHNTAESAMVRRKFSFARLIGITPEFTAGDKAISLSLFSYRIAWFMVFAFITVWNIPAAWRWPERWWINFWHVTCIYLPFAIAIVMVVWFTWGGARDIRRLFERLKTAQRNALDDGTVGGRDNVVDAEPAQRPGHVPGGADSATATAR